MANPLSIILSKVKVGVALSCCMTGMGGRCTDLMAFHGNVVDAVRMRAAEEGEPCEEPSPAGKPMAQVSLIQNCDNTGRFPTLPDERGVYFKLFFDVGLRDSSFDPALFWGSSLGDGDGAHVVELPCVHVDVGTTRTVIFGDPEEDPAYKLSSCLDFSNPELNGISLQCTVIDRTVKSAPVCYDQKTFTEAHAAALALGSSCIQ